MDFREQQTHVSSTKGWLLLEGEALPRPFKQSSQGGSIDCFSSLESVDGVATHRPFGEPLMGPSNGLRTARKGAKLRAPPCRRCAFVSCLNMTPL